METCFATLFHAQCVPETYRSRFVSFVLDTSRDHVVDEFILEVFDGHENGILPMIVRVPEQIWESLDQLPNEKFYAIRLDVVMLDYLDQDVEPVAHSFGR